MIRIKLLMLAMCLATPAFGKSFVERARPAVTVLAKNAAPKKSKTVKASAKKDAKVKASSSKGAKTKSEAPKSTVGKSASKADKKKDKKKDKKVEAKPASKKAGPGTKTLKAQAPKKQPKPTPEEDAFEPEETVSEETVSEYDSGDDYTSLWLALFVAVLLAGLGGYFYAARKNQATARDFDFNESDVIGDAKRNALGESFSVADQMADRLRGEARPGDPDAEFAPLASDQVTLTKNHVRPTSGLSGVFGKLKDVATGSGIGRRKAKEQASAVTEKTTGLSEDEEGVA